MDLRLVVGGLAAAAVLVSCLVLVLRWRGRGRAITAALLVVAFLATGGVAFSAWATWRSWPMFTSVTINGLADHGGDLTFEIRHRRISKSGDDYELELLGAGREELHEALIRAGGVLEERSDGWSLVKDGVRFTVVERAGGHWYAANETVVVDDGERSVTIAFPSGALSDASLVAGEATHLRAPAKDVLDELLLLGGQLREPGTVAVPASDGTVMIVHLDREQVTVTGE